MTSGATRFATVATGMVFTNCFGAREDFVTRTHDTVWMRWR